MPNPEGYEDVNLDSDYEVQQRALQQYDSGDAKKKRMQQYASPGDMVMEVSPGEWKVMRPAGRRQNTTLKQFAADQRDNGFGDPNGPLGDRRARMATGAASTFYGLDEFGNPTFGKTPGIVYDTMALGTLPSSLLQIVSMKQMQMLGFKPEQSAKMAQDMWPVPKWAQDASEKADAIHSAVREDMDLAPPRGFEQHANESLGTMLTQLPIPGGPEVKAVQAGAKAPTAMRVAKSVLGAPAEWLSPTIRPTAGNYLTGTLAGGAIGKLGDSDNEYEDLDWRYMDEDHGQHYRHAMAEVEPGHWEIVPIPNVQEDTEEHADGGFIGGNMNGTTMRDLRGLRAKYAEGGRASKAVAAIKNAIAHLDNNDTAAAMRTLRASPEALADPAIAAAMRKLMHPSTAGGGRRALTGAVESDTNKVVEATFAKGGKVSAVDTLLKKAKGLLSDDTGPRSASGRHKVGDKVTAPKELTAEDADQVGTVVSVNGEEVKIKFSDAPGDHITAFHDEVAPAGSRVKRSQRRGRSND